MNNTAGKKIMNKKQISEKIINSERETVCGCPDIPETCIMRICETGLFERHVVVESGLGGEPAEIVQITDVHFNYCDKEDEQNEELMHTKVCRRWNAGAASVSAIRKAMDYASAFDKTIITGDTLDYLSHGAMELTQKEIWDRDPDALICLGGHELTREMETGEGDRTSLSSRLEVLSAFWKHNMYYVSQIISGKVMIIALDNSRGSYSEEQYVSLEKDITRARKARMPVLIFQHEPLCTGKTEDTDVKPIRVYDPKYHDFYNDSIGSPSRKEESATKSVYNLICRSADTVKGIFCGHLHSAFYTEINAVDSENRPAVIPQHVLEGCVYDGYAGHVMRITVK